MAPSGGVVLAHDGDGGGVRAQGGPAAAPRGGGRAGAVAHHPGQQGEEEEEEEGVVEDGHGEENEEGMAFLGFFYKKNQLIGKMYKNPAHRWHFRFPIPKTVFLNNADGGIFLKMAVYSSKKTRELLKMKEVQ